METSHNAVGLPPSPSAHLSQNLPRPRAPCNGQLLRQARQQQHPRRHAAGNSQHQPCCSGDFTRLKLLLQPSHCGPWLILKEVPYRSGHNEAINYYVLGRYSCSNTTFYKLLLSEKLHKVQLALIPGGARWAFNFAPPPGFDTACPWTLQALTSHSRERE